jgi:hypothetical protein
METHIYLPTAQVGVSRRGAVMMHQLESPRKPVGSWRYIIFN